MMCKRGLACQLLRFDARREVPLTPERTAAVKDQSIDFSDIPELDEEFQDRSEVVEPDRIDQITMRVERSVLACFEAPGKGYQTRMNCTVRYIAKQCTDALARDYTAMLPTGILLDDDESFDTLMQRCVVIEKKANAASATYR